MRPFEYSPPAYSPMQGIRTEWIGEESISVRVDGNEVVIAGNEQGLTTLAKHLLTLAQESVPAGCHLHYDAGNELEEGSCGLIIERIASS